MSKENIITGVLVDTKTNEIKVVKVENELEAKYEILNCDLIDSQMRKFGEYWLDVIFDDEFCYKEESKPAIYTYHNDEIVELIMGNCLIVNHDDDGNYKSLTEDEINAVMKKRRFCMSKDNKDTTIYNILTAEV